MWCGVACCGVMCGDAMQRDGSVCLCKVYVLCMYVCVYVCMWFMHGVIYVGMCVSHA